ncbi:hypothetical protein F4775DRAFT_597365 [Biscogniauxia sp. FL1348]|nr:hypothetical protein F4775DRAFT_597365 [Biscogniauxia sp. FL1348]
MSASAPESPSASADITCIATEPFTPRPVIADILRTRYCVPGSIFLVEGIDAAYTSRSRRWRALRLLLGDGELCIQALLATAMHGFADRGEIAFGSYVRLERFRMEWAHVSSDGTEAATSRGKKTAGVEEQAVYLVVEDLILVGWNNRLVDSADGEPLENRLADVLSDEETDGGTPTASEIPTHAEAGHAPEAGTGSDTGVLQDPGDASDEFEVMSVSAEQRTQNQNHLVAQTPSVGEPIIEAGSPAPQPSKELLASALKLTRLRSIPHLPYKQNWAVNVVAVVAALSEVEPAGLPPYRQRRARLADPSTDKHVLLTVFLDPQRFAPAVGSVVLLLGVKNHRFDGGCLKKYASDRPSRAAGESWWFENPHQLPWCDVAGLHRWWRSRE